MKKIVISLSCVIVAIISVVVASIVLNRKQKIELSSFDQAVLLDLGNYKVKNYEKSSVDGENDSISFNVENQNDFYNDVIKASNYYFEELSYVLDDGIYGYLFKADRYFYFKCTNNNVVINSISLNVTNEENSYYLIVDSHGMIGFDEQKTSDISRTWKDNNRNFDDVKKFYSLLDEKYWKLENNSIYLKGINGSKSTEEYLCKISNVESRIQIEVFNLEYIS